MAHLPLRAVRARALGPVLGLWLAGGVALAAAAQARDLWHFVDPSSPFYTAGMESAPGAAIAQGNGTEALLRIGRDGRIWISLALPDAPVSAAIRSTLVRPDRQTFQRDIDGQHLLRTSLTDGTPVFSFLITQRDLELFMASDRWRIEVKDKAYDITLLGSRAAIEAAIAEAGIQLSGN